MKLPSLATLLRPPVQTLPLFPHLVAPLALLAVLAAATLFAHSDVNAALLWSQCHARERLPLLTDARFVPSWVATPACFLVSFLGEALDARRSRAAVAELLAGVGALMSVATGESARRCNERAASRIGRGVIAMPTAWWVLFNLIGGALVWQVVIVPAFLHRARMWFSVGRDEPLGVSDDQQQHQPGHDAREDEDAEEEQEKVDTDRSVADAEIVAIPLAVALGFYLPSVLMLVFRSPGAVAAWLPFPVYVSLLRQGVRWAVGRLRRSTPGRVHIEYVTRRQRRAHATGSSSNNSSGSGGSNKPLAAMYGLPALASVAAHALLVANLTAGRDDRREMTRSTVKFLEVDAQFLALTVLYWVFAEVGWRAPATMLLVGAVLGPGAGVCAGWVVRERLLREALRRLVWGGADDDEDEQVEDGDGGEAERARGEREPLLG
ncbi:Clustered mitochondria protein [Purpureocillium lavendulum]|uniref:Clustered mitochondria protein n=1 Tax=Purpureocillium lavendulum TaxID=1247861 RepID=A0AB34FPH6_9HYPO|nr:Clustered mitochondria protein [Purpureocillium lavendulum]